MLTVQTVGGETMVLEKRFYTWHSVGNGNHWPLVMKQFASRVRPLFISCCLAVTPTAAVAQ